MTAPTYPLQAALDVKAHAEDAAKSALADAIAELARREEAVTSAARQIEAHRAQTEAWQEREAGAGARAIADVLRGQAYLERRRTEAAALADALRAAQDSCDSARDAVSTARRALATARAEREAIEKHYAAWQAERRRARLAKEEEEADELAGRN